VVLSSDLSSHWLVTDHFESSSCRFFLSSFHFLIHSVLFASVFLAESRETLYSGWQYTAPFIVIISAFNRFLIQTSSHSGLFLYRLVQWLREWNRLSLCCHSFLESLVWFSFVWLCFAVACWVKFTIHANAIDWISILIHSNVTILSAVRMELQITIW
jgi:hypothetical protein